MVFPVQVKPRRQGDVASMYADASLAKEMLGWVAKRSLEDMCADSWRWQSSHPNGYEVETSLATELISAAEDKNPDLAAADTTCQALPQR